MIPHDSTEHVDAMPGIGDLIGGRYRLEEVIGHGALGTVMRAEHITLGRKVAVKMLRPDISGHPTVRRRLIERVQRAQRLTHPNNCRLLDFGHAGDSLYLVMELLEGATLRVIIDRGAPYPVGWVVDIGMQILSGLGEAHDEGLIHRNLKPSNVFLLPRRRGGQRVKVLDYGLASSLDSLADDEEDDRDTEVCGTATYMAPETLVHQQSSEATDVYAVGLILIEMLTGRRVFGGDSLTEILYRQIHTSVTLPPKLAWTSLGKVLLKSVRKHPGSRLHDADAFYEALEEASESTAPYFRLDSGDMLPRKEELPPEVLDRMMRDKGKRRESDRDGGDEGDDDSDESEPSDGALESLTDDETVASSVAVEVLSLMPAPLAMVGALPADGRSTRRHPSTHPTASEERHPVRAADGEAAATAAQSSGEAQAAAESPTVDSTDHDEETDDGVDARPSLFESLVERSGLSTARWVVRLAILWIAFSLLMALVAGFWL
ncbi:MAG: serine/threonine-protein kinase [Persicimonas sp.]